jgi:FkbM family methyltransferase
MVTRRFHPRGTNRLLTKIYSPGGREFDHFETVMKYDSRLLININTADFLEWLVFFYGYHEPGLTRQIKRIFQPGFVAFDVGANVGSHSLIMSDRAGKDGKIFAVEPNPVAAQRLRENIALNQLDNIAVLSYAFSDAPADKKLFVPVEGTANRGVASLYPENVNYQRVEVPVEVITMDEVVRERGLSRLDFIKIDTEGNELKVLRGARNCIAKYRPLIVFEYDLRSWSNSGTDFAVAKEYFSGLNYSLSVIGPRSLTTVGVDLPVTGNILAAPKLISV